MRRYRIPFLLLVLAACTAQAQPPLRYTVDLNNRAEAQFNVTLRVDSLPAGSGTFQFAATAPGTYEVMDIGRFVRSFRALDATGREVPSAQVSTNQWKISAPGRVRQIRYSIAETLDAPVTEHPVYDMCSSALREDHALINGQAVFGFPTGMQAAAISVRLLAPGNWTIGTAMPLIGGAYQAEDYDQLVDSPILAGRLTHARVDVTGVPVDIYTYSRSGRIDSQQLADAMRSMLLAAGEFLGKLPVDRYTFLYHFLDRNAGAWEHSYSSEYSLADTTLYPAFGKAITDMAAHEFFHVVTPLNLHSQIIEHFNFVKPVPSRHLWLYEGTTEWAAHKMQLEAGLEPASAYLATVVQKVRTDRLAYDTTWSLTELAMTSYSDSGQVQYPNIYQRGAVVAGLLDIRLLELSQGAHGLRDLIADLSKTYGKHRAFEDDSLEAIVVRHTSPAIREFFDRYIAGNEHPPVKEYYAKLGFRLIEDERGLPVRFVPDPDATPEQLRLRKAWLGKHGLPIS